MDREIYKNKLFSSLKNYQCAGKKFWTLWNNVSRLDLTTRELLSLQQIMEQHEAWLNNNVERWESV